MVQNEYPEFDTPYLFSYQTFRDYFAIDLFAINHLNIHVDTYRYDEKHVMVSNSTFVRTIATNASSCKRL